MNERDREILREFPLTPHGKVFIKFIDEELGKLKDVMTVKGEVELQARQDAVKYLEGLFIHFRPKIDKPNNSSYT